MFTTSTGINKFFCTAVIFSFFITYQLQTFAFDSTSLGPKKRRPPPLHPYVLDFGVKRIETSDGGTLASTSSACQSNYQLRYLVSLVNTENNDAAFEVSNIWLQTCLAANKNIIINKKANVNYFGPYTATGKITVSYWYICQPCKNCKPVAANC